MFLFLSFLQKDLNRVQRDFNFNFYKMHPVSGFGAFTIIFKCILKCLFELENQFRHSLTEIKSF